MGRPLKYPMLPGETREEYARRTDRIRREASKHKTRTPESHARAAAYTRAYRERHKSRLAAARLTPGWKAKKSEEHRRYKLDHPEKFKIKQRTDRLRAYGMTREEFSQMFENQEGLCAICSRHMCLCTDRKCAERACVDHDHGSGEVRGLLCHGCNSGIGMMRESPTALRNAIGYLEGAA